MIHKMIISVVGEIERCWRLTGKAPIKITFAYHRYYEFIMLSPASSIYVDGYGRTIFCDIPIEPEMQEEDVIMTTHNGESLSHVFEPYQL